MKIPHFTDDQLESYFANAFRDMTSLEQQLAATIIEDRKVFRKLLEETEPLAAQIICPSDNTFRRQCTAIESRL